MLLRDWSMTEGTRRGSAGVGLRYWKAVGIKKGLLFKAVRARSWKTRGLGSHLSLLALTSSLHAIARFDNVCFEADRSRGTMKLQEEAAGIAQHRAHLIATPKRSSRGRAILTYRL